MWEVSTPYRRNSRSAEVPMSLSGRALTNAASSPKLARATATLASPPPKVASSTGDWKKRSWRGVLRRSMISPKVTNSAKGYPPARFRGGGVLTHCPPCDGDRFLRQACDPRVVAVGDGAGRREPASAAGDYRRHLKVIMQIPCRNAPGRNEAYIAEYGSKGLEHGNAAGQACREVLQYPQTQIPCTLHFAGRGHAGHDGDRQFAGGGDDAFVQAGRHDEPGAGRYGCSGLLFAQYGARAHMRLRHDGGNGADGLDRRGRAQGDLHDRQSARYQGPGYGHGVRSVFDHDNGHDGRSLEHRGQAGCVAG